MGLQLSDSYVGGGGLKAVVYGNLFQTFRHWGMHKEEKKQEKTLHFLLLYFSPCECLEQFIISYIAVLSYLEQWNVDWYTHCTDRLYGLRDPPLSNTQPESIFLGNVSHHVLRVSTDFHQVIYPICSVLVVAPTLCALARISYFKSRDLS